MKITHYITLIVLFFAVSSDVVQPANNSPLVNINVLADIAKKEFLNDYYGYLQVDPKFLEDESYVNNLVILCDLDRNFPENGTILLALINQLEKINDAPSRYLLSKLSKLFNLEFHDFICRMELPKEKQASLYKSYYHLNNHSVTQQDGEIYPFRVLLTKTIVSFFVIHYSQTNFNQKKSSWILTLEKLRKKMHRLNKTLGDNSVSSEIINDFSDLVEAYSLTEPLVQPKKARRLILQSLIIIAVAAVAVYGIKVLLDQKFWIGIDPKNPKNPANPEDPINLVPGPIDGHTYIKNIFKDWSQAIMEGAMIPVKTMAHEIVEEFGRQGVVIGENVIIGATTVRGIPNPAFNAGLPESPANQRLIPPAADPSRLPNPLMTEMGTMISAGLATVPGIPNPAFNAGLPESAANPRLIPAPSDPNRVANPSMRMVGEQVILGLATVETQINPAFNAGLPESAANPRRIPVPTDTTRAPNPLLTDMGTMLSAGLATVQGIPNPAFNNALPESPANPRLIPAPTDPTRVANPNMRMVGEQVILGIATIETRENPAYAAGDHTQPQRIPVPVDPTRHPNPLLTDMGTMLSAGLATVQGIPNPAFNNALPESAANPRLIPAPTDPTRLPNPSITELGELLSLGIATVKGVPNPAFNAALPESRTNQRLIPEQGDPTRISNPSIVQAGELMGDGLVTALVETTVPRPQGGAGDNPPPAGAGDNRPPAGAGDNIPQNNPPAGAGDNPPPAGQVNGLEQVGENIARGAIDELRRRNTAATRNLVGAPEGQEGWYRGIFGNLFG